MNLRQVSTGAALALAASIGSASGQHFIMGTQTSPSPFITPYGTAAAVIKGPGGASVVAVADSAAMVGGTVNAGLVEFFVWNSTPGSPPVRTLSGTQRVEFFGSSLTVVPDLDGDGWEDLIIGSPRAFAPGSVRFVSGNPTPPPGSWLPKTLGGAAATDEMGSGATEINWLGIRVWVILGKDKASFVWLDVNNNPIVFNTITAAPLRPAPNLTAPIVNVGDVDGDTADDFAYSDLAGTRVVSGVGGNVLRTIANADPGYGTAMVAGALPTIYVGAPGALGSTGRLYAYDASTGMQITSWTGAVAGGSFGRSVATGDTDGDGFTDVIVGAPGTAAIPGSVTIYSGANNALLYGGGIPPGPIGSGWGTTVLGLGDVDANGYDDYLVSLPFGARATYACSGGPIATAVETGVGCGCAGPPPRLLATPGQRPVLGGTISLTLLDNTNPNSPVVLMVGTPAAARCLLVNPIVLDYSYVLTGGSLTTPAFPVGTSPALMGAVVSCQFAVAAVCGTDTSNRLDLTVGL